LISPVVSQSTPEREGSFISRLERWLRVMPHPDSVVEIDSTHVGVARWEGPRLLNHAVEPLGAGSIVPSPVETNVTRPAVVEDTLRRTLMRAGQLQGPVALLVPDPVVRVFLLPFDSLPRRAEDALPLLRWRLKKSVPFDVEETSVSWSRQKARDGGLEVVAAVARRKIIREYEQILEGLGLSPTVVLSSTLATLPLVGERGSTLLVRMNARTMTTAIVRGSALCLYRSTEMPADASALEPKWMLEEIFPATAFYQDTWSEPIDRVVLAGFPHREDVFRSALEGELKVPARSLEEVALAATLDPRAMVLMEQGLHPFVGWTANAGAHAS